jgi:hypothetical protein
MVRGSVSAPRRKCLQMIILARRIMFLVEENAERKGNGLMYSKVNKIPRFLLPESNHSPTPLPVKAEFSPCCY